MSKFHYGNLTKALIEFTEHAYEPQAVFERAHWKTSDGKVEVGYGIQRLPCFS